MPNLLSKFMKSKTIQEWGGKTVFFFTYTHFSHDLTTGLLVALLPFIRQDLGLNYLQAGLLVSAYSLTSGFSQLLGGSLTERLGRKNTIALGLGGVGFTTFILGFASSYYVLLTILVAMGIFAGFYHPSAVSTLTNQFESQQRGRVVALHMIGGSLGFGIGPLLGAIISSNLSWHYAFMILSLPAIVAMPLVLTTLKLPALIKQPKNPASSGVAGQKTSSVWTVFRSAAGIIALSVAMQLITGPVVSFIPLFLVDVHHLSAAAGSTWLTVIRMGGLAGSLFGGWLTDKWGRTRAIFLALILFGPVIFLLARLPFGIALAVVFILLGWLMSMRETTMQTYLMDNTAPQLRATVFGIYFSFGQQGSSVIQPVAGNFMDKLGITSVYNIFAYIAIGLSALSAFVAWKKTKAGKLARPVNS
jgi:FSR family fosmidomycin resistance protein-like MFS transporter